MAFEIKRRGVGGGFVRCCSAFCMFAHFSFRHDWDLGAKMLLCPTPMNTSDGTSPPALGAAHFSALIEASEDAIISKTLDGCVLTWNPAAERIYGYGAEEARGESMTFLLPPDRSDEEKEILREIARGMRVEHFETTRLRKDGRVIDVSI